MINSQMPEKTARALKGVVKKTLKARSKNLKVLDIIVSLEYDSHDNDYYCRIEVIYDDRMKFPETVEDGLIRRIRPELDKIGVEFFPVFSFIADSEYKALSTATA